MIYCRYWPYTWGGWYQYLPCTQDCWHLYSINYHVLLMVDININQITMYIWELVLIHVFNMYILLTVDICTILTMYYMYWQLITMYLGRFTSVQLLAYVLQMVDIEITKYLRHILYRYLPCTQDGWYRWDWWQWRLSWFYGWMTRACLSRPWPSNECCRVYLQRRWRFHWQKIKWFLSYKPQNLVSLANL